MEPKTKYQYTYFTYPYVINEKKYDKYLVKLLKNKKCHIRIFEKKKDLNLYTYFLPKVRQYLFWSFDMNKSKLKKLEELEEDTRAAVLSKFPCTIFEYEIEKDIQGKVGEKNGIFFTIHKIEIICFKTGICFLNFKTTLEGENTFSDVCNFNYKFRDINSELAPLKEYENIRIQTDIFKDTQEFSNLIKEIAGNNIGAKELNLDTERFITYAYQCIGQEYWDEKDEVFQKQFYQYANIKPANYVVDYKEKNSFATLEEGKSIKFGFSNIGTALLASDIHTQNYTKLPYTYENEYLYTYILALYKKLYLKKLLLEFNTSGKFDKTKQKFIEFTKEIWIQEITNDDMGSLLYKQWDSILNGTTTYLEVKNKYDVLYKNANIEKTTKANKWIAVILAVMLIINLINLIAIFNK